MSVFKIIGVAAVGMCLSISAQAQVKTTTGNVKIASISNGWGAEGYYFYASGITQSMGCSSDNRFFIPASRADYKLMVAQLIAAYSLKSNVAISINSCAGNIANVVGIQSH